MTQHTDAIRSLEKIQQLLGELDFTLTQHGYYKDYGLSNGSIIRIVPLFDKGLSLDIHYNLSGLSLGSSETIPIISGKQISFDRIPAECREDVLRMLAELAPEALIPKTESFILNMICTECRKEVSSYFSLKGVIKCVECMGYNIK